MANPLSKSKIIAHMAEKVSTPEKPVSKKQTWPLSSTNCSSWL